MDDIKQTQLTNLRVWCRRFNLEFSEPHAVEGIEAASQFPGLSGSVRRLPLALIFSKKIDVYYPKIYTASRQLLAFVFATVMVAKVYDGDITPWNQAVQAELYRLYGTDIESAKKVVEKTQPLVTLAGEWYKEASAVRDKEYQTLGGMLKRALRDLE